MPFVDFPFLADHTNVHVYSVAWGYRGGSPTAVQAWPPCPVWEPFPSQSPHISVDLGFAVFLPRDAL